MCPLHDTLDSLASRAGVILKTSDSGTYNNATRIVSVRDSTSNVVTQFTVPRANIGYIDAMVRSFLALHLQICDPEKIINQALLGSTNLGSRTSQESDDAIIADFLARKTVQIPFDTSYETITFPVNTQPCYLDSQRLHESLDAEIYAHWWTLSADIKVLHLLRRPFTNDDNEINPLTHICTPNLRHTLQQKFGEDTIITFPDLVSSQRNDNPDWEVRGDKEFCTDMYGEIIDAEISIAINETIEAIEQLRTEGQRAKVKVYFQQVECDTSSAKTYPESIVWGLHVEVTGQDEKQFYDIEIAITELETAFMRAIPNGMGQIKTNELSKESKRITYWIEPKKVTTFSRNTMGQFHSDCRRAKKEGKNKVLYSLIPNETYIPTPDGCKRIPEIILDFSYSFE